MATVNASGTKIGSYTYDAWGNCTVSLNSDATTAEKRIVRTYNPFRYRGYYYDTETSLYYLQSRYYNPATGRFINADGYVNANGDLIGFNMYAYCSNNPVMNVDFNGEFVISLSALLIGIAIGAGVGAGISLGATALQDYSDDGEIFNGSVGVDEYIGNTLGGLIAGAGVGTCTVLGAGLGAAITASEMLSVGSVAMSGAAAFGLGTGAAFASGAAGYAVRTAISSKETFQCTDMFIEAGVNAVSGIASFFGGMIGGATGIKVPGAKNGAGNFFLYHGAMTVLGIYPTKYIVSVLKNRMQEIF